MHVCICRVHVQPQKLCTGNYLYDANIQVITCTIFAEKKEKSVQMLKDMVKKYSDNPNY